MGLTMVGVEQNYRQTTIGVYDILWKRTRISFGMDEQLFWRDFWLNIMDKTGGDWRKHKWR